MLNAEVFHFDQAAALPAACASLFQAGERDSFDLSADWFRLLAAEARFAGVEPRCYVLTGHGAVRGVLPLAVQRSRIGICRINSFTNYYSSLYRPLLAPSMDAQELAQYLRMVQAQTHAASARFDAMDPAHPAFDLLESALCDAGFRTFRFFGFGNWYLPVQGRSFEAYFASLPSRLCNTVRRREKKFFAEGRGALKIVDSAAGLDEAIAAWDKIYRASWKRPEPYTGFMPGLIRLCAARGWLRLGLACYDGEPVAAQLWIVNQGRAAIYKLAYDAAFAQLSAGTVLTAHLMRHSLDVDKVAEVDYLMGDDEYKKDWMSQRRERWGLLAFNVHSAYGLLGAINQQARLAAKRVIGKIRSISR